MTALSALLRVCACLALLAVAAAAFYGATLLAALQSRVMAVDAGHLENLVYNTAALAYSGKGVTEEARATVAAVQPVLASARQTVDAARPVLVVLSERTRQASSTIDAATLAVGRLDALVASTQGDLHSAIGHLDEQVKAAGPVLANAAEITRQVADAAPGVLDVLTDCESNPSCFTNRWIGLTYDLEQTMRTIQKAAPEMSKSTNEIAAHFDSMAGSADKWVSRQLAPPTKKQTFFSAIERFGLIGLRAWLLL